MRRAVLFALALTLVTSCGSSGAAEHPVGTLLVSMDGPNGRGDIYSIRADGSSLRNLTRTADDEYHPSWSPDGRRFVFMRYDALFVRNADGSNERRLTASAGDPGPAWSPGGGRIAFVAERPGKVETAVWTIRPDGTGRRLVGGRGNFPEAPTWSPDGRRLAFSSDVPRGGEDDTRIWVMNDDGSDVHPVSRGDIDVDPAWSPDGDRIIFVRGFQLISTSPDRIDEKPLNASVQSPAWSPDGDWIAAVQIQRSTGYGLYLLRPEGGVSRRILRLRGLVYSAPSWWMPPRFSRGSKR